MTERDDELAQVERAAQELIPLLSERLAKHGLGELEVRLGTLRVRVAAGPVAPGAAATGSAAGPRTLPPPSPTPAEPTTGGASQPPSPAINHGITSPAVGFFVYADGLGPGLSVEKGDDLGHVEMLGVRHDVRAPRRGTVRNLVTEAGEPVEYGQLLIELEPAE